MEDIPATTITTGKFVYVDFPSSYSINFYRGLACTCALSNKLIANSNFATSCSFISKRRLKITISTDSTNTAAT